MSDVSNSEPTKDVVEERAKRTTRFPAKHKDYVPSTSKEEELLQKSKFVACHVLFKPN